MTDATFAKTLADARDELLYIARERYGLYADDAEDLASYTIYRAWSYREQYVERGDGPMQWLLNLLRWSALNYLRGERRRRQRYITASDMGIDIEWLAGPVETEEDDSEARRRRAQAVLPDMLAVLSGCQREVLMLRAADHQYDEIAAMLGVPLGTVKSRLFRARKRITEAMNGGTQ